VDTNQLIVGLHRILGRLIEENIELKIEESTQVVPAYVDLGQIEQVIINLVVNARDAMPDGGRINIGLRTTDRLPGLIGPLHGPTASEYVVFSVEDTGMGMTEDVISRIFEPFFTTKAVGAGTGLGLSTCYGIVTQADGHIAVESKVGVGSKFQVYLPKAKEIKANLEAPTNNRLMLLGVERVMVVEGEPALKMLISGILSKRGYQVTDASNGIEALSLTREHPNDTIDLLITDIVMPKMGGKQLATELKLNHPEMKVLYMSGYPDVHSDILEADPVNSSFIRKPFTFEALEQKVRQSIEM
jgi:CheY-like chemotaxis protein